MSEQTGAAERKAENTETRESQQQSENRGEHRRHGRGRNRNRQGRGGQHQQQQPDPSLNMTELREIAALFSEHGLTDFEFENENIRVRFRKELAPQIVQAAAPPQTFTAAPQVSAPPASATQLQTPETAETASATASATDEDANLKKITSPIVGTFYRSPSPGAEPFVSIGSQVSPDTIVCIVEAMKLMNEIPAEVSGEIVKIYVENGQPVEYGQPLFAIK